MKEEAARREQMADTNRKYTDSKLDTLEGKLKKQIDEGVTGRVLGMLFITYDLYDAPVPRIKLLGVQIV